MKLGRKHKLRSGALQFTIFISVLVALLLAGIIMLASTHKFFIEQSRAGVENIQLCDTGMLTLLHKETISNDTIPLALPEAKEGQTIAIHLSHWGIFEKAYVKAAHRKKTFVKCALLGTGLLQEDRPSVYLSETFNPLAVVGYTEIKGKAILPAQGVRPGNISGNSYYGKELINGLIEKSTPDLPKLKFDYKTILDYYLHTYEPENDGKYMPLGSPKIVNSFKQGTKGYFSKNPIVLENTAIHGNIIIRSDDKIIIKKTADLRDVIVAAPIIIIEDGVIGNFQAIADTTIKAGKECTLQYPSALVMIERKSSNDSVISTNGLPQDEYYNKIYIDSNSVVKGSICYFNTIEQERDFKTNIFVGPKSVVRGEIYCETNLELKSALVEGSVYTKHFISNEGGTTFINHLYNSGINSEALPEAFGGMVFDDRRKNVMKWLY